MHTTGRRFFSKHILSFLETTSFVSLWNSLLSEWPKIEKVHPLSITISALMSPNGQEGIVPVQVYSCGNCGAVPSSLLEGTDITGKELGEETDS